jgi:SAM-dependent methyltransferase
MSFYTNLSDVYEHIFPLGEITYAFLKKHATEPVLDIGCASGAYVRRFHEDGLAAEGIEYVPELIKYSRNVRTGDMRKLPAEFSEKFGLAFCIGNTLAHCEDAADAAGILKSISNILKSGGKAVIQILNYEKILKYKPETLPSLNAESVTFERLYDYLPSKIKFTGVLSSGIQKTTSSVELYPLTLSELTTASNEAGLSVSEYYGDFEQNPFQPEESFMLVCVLKKHFA